MLYGLNSVGVSYINFHPYFQCTVVALSDRPTGNVSM